LVFVNRSRSRSRYSKSYVFCVFCVRFSFRFRSKLQKLKASVFSSLFAILLKLSPYCFETDRPNSSVLKSVFNYTDSKYLLPYSRKIAKEALDIVFRLIRANYIYNINLLVVFLFPKNTNIIWLK
jgi:hypothetical protein